MLNKTNSLDQTILDWLIKDTNTPRNKAGHDNSNIFLSVIPQPRVVPDYRFFAYVPRIPHVRRTHVRAQISLAKQRVDARYCRPREKFTRAENRTMNRPDSFHPLSNIRQLLKMKRISTVRTASVLQVKKARAEGNILFHISTAKC